MWAAGEGEGGKHWEGKGGRRKEGEEGKRGEGKAPALLAACAEHVPTHMELRQAWKINLHLQASNHSCKQNFSGSLLSVEVGGGGHLWAVPQT